MVKVNKLSLNTNKTNHMRFHNKPHLIDCNPKIDELEVNRVRVTKFLGVLVDEKLSWSNYINAVCLNVSKNIYVIYKVKHMLENNHLYTLYCSLILPYLCYACEIWGNTSINFILWCYYKRKQSIISYPLIVGSI